MLRRILEFILDALEALAKDDRDTRMTADLERRRKAFLAWLYRPP